MHKVENHFNPVLLIFIFVLSLFLIGGLVTLSFINNPDHLTYSNDKEAIFDSFDHDLDSMMLITIEEYELYKASTDQDYSIYSSHDGTYLIYHLRSPYGEVLTDMKPKLNFTELSFIYEYPDGTPIKLYVSTEVNPSYLENYDKDNITFFSYEILIAKSIEEDPLKIGLVDKDIYDRIIIDLYPNLEFVSYESFYFLYHPDNPDKDILSSNEQSIESYLLTKDTYSDGSIIHRISYQGQLPLQPNQLLNFDMLNGYNGHISNLGIFLSILIPFMILTPMLVYLSRKEIKEDYVLLKVEGRRFFFLNIAVYTLVLVAVIVAMSRLTMTLSLTVFEQTYHMPAFLSFINMNSFGIYGLLIALLWILIIPVFQELILRKALFEAISNHAVALITSSLLFSLMYVVFESSLSYMLIHGIRYFLISLIIGFAYLKSNKNVVFSTVLHIIINILTIFTLLIILN